MNTAVPIIGGLIVLGLLIKYWWVALIIAIVAGIATWIVKVNQRRSKPATRPVTPRPTPQQQKVTASRIHTASPVLTAKPAPGQPAKPPATQAILCALLTRQPTNYPAADTVYTAVDIETTGLDPSTCRIVEIGLVKFTRDGTVLDEFTTLINNPGSPREARDVHGIADTDLRGAPDTADVLPEVFAFIAGTVLVAHNLEFEAGFLTAAARRARLPIPALAGVCTLKTSRRQLDGRAYSLTVMYKTATGEFPVNKHTALGDARSLREVLLWLLRNAPSPLYLTERPPSTGPASDYECQISCRPVPLTGASVAELLTSFPQSPLARKGAPEEIEAYLALLAESVEDGLLTYEEAQALTGQARRTRLTGTQLWDLHRQAWEATFADEKDADWTALAPVRRREMYLLADALGLSNLAGQIKDAIDACAEPDPPAQARYLRGLRIGIVGTEREIIQLRTRAEENGAKLAVNITKTVVWMATTTPDAADAKHNSARKFGVPMLTPA